jgi:secreted trypsin-like serine protease
VKRIGSFAALTAALVALAFPGAGQAVTGGTPPSRDYEFMAAMLWDDFQYCGGSLVAPEYVLTAAHCWDDPKVDEVDFVIGGANLTLDEWDAIPAQSVDVHEKWGETDFGHDVAVVRLSEPAQGTPIPLADPETERDLWVAEPGLLADRKPARVIGYGLPSFDPPGALFETDVAMVADEDCEASYNLTGGGFENDTMVCAGEPYGVKDACFGDSGGPLMVAGEGDLSSGTLVQVGVVSWGFLCGVPTQPGVYSRVADDPLHSWIQQRIGGGGGNGGGEGGSGGGGGDKGNKGNKGGNKEDNKGNKN